MDFFRQLRLPVKLSMLVALTLAGLKGYFGVFEVGSILYDFVVFTIGLFGLTLILGTFAPILKFSPSIKGRVRPNRSKSNELGSGDMASKSHMTQWLNPTDDDDTVLICKDLVGSERLPAKDGKLYLPGGERNRHVLFIAKTGSGKTTKAILPILYSDCLSKKRSSVIVDSKPEMWEKLAGMTAELNPEKNIMLFNPLDMMRSLSWNIVSKVEDDTDAKLIANTLIMATDNPNSKSDSPFFRNNALQLINAMMVGLLNDPDEVLSIPRVHELLHSGKNELCDWLEVHPHAIRNAKTFVELARGGSQNADTILSELGMRLAAWDLKAIRATTFDEELDLQKLIDEPTLFIVEFRESEMEMLRPIANVIVIEVLRFLTKAAEKYEGHKLPRPVGLVIDEFASSLGRLPDIHVKLNTLRSRNVSIVAAIQSIAQIKANYDKDADSVLAGFSTKILMPMLDFQDAEWASKETGTMTIRFKTQTTGSNKRMPDAFAHNSRGTNEQVQQRAVLTPDEIGRPIDNCATFFLPNTPVFQGHLIPFYELPYMRDAIGSGSDYQVREEPIHYEENLPDMAELKAKLAASKAAQANGGGDGQAIGAIQPTQREKTPEELAVDLDKIKEELDWENTTGVAREWWEAFEKQNADKMGLVVTLGHEIKKREATITEFFLAYLYSNSDNIEENLAYLETMKEREAEEKANESKESADSEPQDPAPVESQATDGMTSGSSVSQEPPAAQAQAQSPAPVQQSVAVQQPVAGNSPPAATDNGWEEIINRLEGIKAELGWAETVGVAREWWEEFEEQNSNRLPLVIALAEEIRRKGGTIKEFFLAYLESGTESIDQNLIYMEKMVAERNQREAQSSSMVIENAALQSKDKDESDNGARAAQPKESEVHEPA